MDISTVSVNKSGFTPGNNEEGKMLELKNPGLNHFAGDWKTHLSKTGPDVIFKNIPRKGGLDITCTEFRKSAR